MKWVVLILFLFLMLILSFVVFVVAAATIFDMLRRLWLFMKEIGSRWEGEE